MATREQQVLESANDIALTAETWADFSNALFDPEEGLVAKAYPTRKDREKFVKTEEYRAIRALVDAVVQRTGLVDGATPKHKSGRFVVRLPKSLHAALDAEAEAEGVSLNQLVVTKLAVQMSHLASGNRPQMAAIAQAYLEVRDGYSIDRVVADPDMNQRFLQRCRELGLADSGFDLNWMLFNGRKNKYFANLPKTRNYTASRKDEFEFSSEIAVRVVQEQIWNRESRRASLDRIICDPDLAVQFDEVAARLAPGFCPLDYRWVALGVRKAAGRYTSEAKSVDLPRFDSLGTVRNLKASRIPEEQGVYIFSCEDDQLFVGDTENLRHRIERHLDSSNKVGIPDWLYPRGSRVISLGIVPMPGATQRLRKVIELGAVNRYRPLFNYINGRSAC